MARLLAMTLDLRPNRRDQPKITLAEEPRERRRLSGSERGGSERRGKGARAESERARAESERRERVGLESGMPTGLERLCRRGSRTGPDCRGIDGRPSGLDGALSKPASLREKRPGSSDLEGTDCREERARPTAQ